MSHANATRPTLLIRLRDHEDGASWTEFVEIYQPLIRRFARSRGVDETNLSDVSQEVLRSVASAIRKFEYDPEKGTFRSWLITAVRREIWRQSRKAQKQAVLLEHEDALGGGDNDEGVEVWERDYQRQLVAWAISKIQPEFSATSWSAFQKSAIEGGAATDVAVELDSSPGAIYVAKSRVLKRLREKIQSVASETWEMDAMSIDKADKGRS